MRANDYIKLYAETVAEKLSYKLKYSHILNFHAIVGACLKYAIVPRGGVNVDLRLHPFIVRPSGSGKALSYDLAEALAKKIGLKWVTRNKITEAGLIGTLQQSKEGLVEIYGDAYDKDIIGFTEASLLLRDTNLCKHFNTLMDVKGIVSRRLAIGEISYKTNTTVVLSSFPNRLVYDHLQTGFLQRCMVFYERLPLRYYREVIEWLANKYGIDERPKVEKQLDRIARRLKEIKKHSFNFTLDAEAKKMMFKTGKEFEDMVKPYPIFQTEVYMTFATRWSEQVLKLATHHASLELRDKIEKRDVEYAKRISKLSLRSVFMFIEDFYIKDKKYLRLEKQLEKFRKERKPVKLSELARRLKPLTVSQIEGMLEVYEARGEIEIDHNKRQIAFL